MKTKNNVQKALLRSGAVIASFVLISFTVSAQDFWKKLLTNSSFNEIAIAMVETSGKTKTTSNEAGTGADLVLFDEPEPFLNLESWMVSDRYFHTPSFQVLEEKENPMELESWMVDETRFLPENEAEQPLELESWMTSETRWSL